MPSKTTISTSGNKKTRLSGKRTAKSSNDDSNLHTYIQTTAASNNAQRRYSLDSASVGSTGEGSKSRNVYIPTALNVSNISNHVNTTHDTIRSNDSEDDHKHTRTTSRITGGIASISGKTVSNEKSIRTTNADDLQAVIASLEEEFDSLNNQYSYLLSSVKSTNNKGVSSSVDSNGSSLSAHAETAEELVDVIQKLHRKGEQLRQLKSPPRKTEA